MDNQRPPQLLAERYHLEDQIGSGGFATVYSGHDKRLDRRIAIKLLHPEHVKNISNLERFLREARTAAQLQHPAIVQTYDFGEQAGWHYIVMEYIEGESLRDYLDTQGGQMPVVDALVNNAMKMRPDRIILGDAMDKEALDILRAMNTGISGSMFAIHANTPRDVLARMENIISLSEPGVPVLAVREQMTSAIDLIVHISRLRDGSRKIISITEVTGMQNNFIVMKALFDYEQTDYDAATSKIIGQLEPTGLLPNFYDQLDGRIPKALFNAPESDD